MNDKFVELVNEYLNSAGKKKRISTSELRYNIESIGVEASLIDDLLIKIDDEFLLEEIRIIQMKKAKSISIFGFFIGFLFLTLSFFPLKYINSSLGEIGVGFRFYGLFLVGFGSGFIYKNRFEKLKSERQHRQIKMKWWL